MSADRWGLHGGGYTELEGGGVNDFITVARKGDDPPSLPLFCMQFSTAGGAGIDQNLEEKEEEFQL